jgi:hypothetical protein
MAAVLPSSGMAVAHDGVVRHVKKKDHRLFAVISQRAVASATALP